MGRISIPLLPRAIRWTCVFAVVAVIFYYSLLDAVSVPPAGGGGALWGDKRLHVVAYATLALVTTYATVQWRGDSISRYSAVLLAVLTYGVAIELAQAPLSGRYYSLADMLANVVGTLVTALGFGVERYIRYERVDILYLSTK